MTTKHPLAVRGFVGAVVAAAVAARVPADARAQTRSGSCVLTDDCATAHQPTGSRCSIDRDTGVEVPDCDIDRTCHPLHGSVPERELVAATGVVRLRWLEGNRVAAWRSRDGRLAFLAEESPDGRLRLLNPEEHAERQSYIEWLSHRPEGGTCG